MKLSVLAICYNHEKYVAQAIESILAQRTDFDFEIIVGDDCSTDSSAQILFSLQQKFPDKLKVIVNEKNLGPHRNFERVFNAAQGEYIALLETDDFWCDPLKLQKQVGLLESDKSLVFCFTNGVIIDDNNITIKEDRVPPEQRRRLTQIDIISGYCPPTNTVVFRRSAMPTLPPEYFKCLNGDFVVFIHMTNSGDAAYLNMKTAYYRKHSNGIWSTKPLDYIYINNLLTRVVLYEKYSQKYGALLLREISLTVSELEKMNVLKTAEKTKQQKFPANKYDSIKGNVDIIVGHLVEGQAECLFDLVNNLTENSAIVEIGSYYGKSTVAMGYACLGTQKTIYCLDLWHHDDGQIFLKWMNNVSANKLDNHIIPMRGYSSTMLELLLKKMGPNSVDFIFVDGSHEYETVLSDFRMSFELLKKGGCIALHDVCETWPGPYNVWHNHAKPVLSDIFYCSTLAIGRKP